MAKFSIPLFSTPDKPLVDTTQDYLPIAEIDENLILFKDGGACIVLESTSLNFGLLSDREKESVIASYAALINSLSFSIQILIRTQRKDITNYLSYLEKKSLEIQEPKMKGLFESYRKFVIETTQRRNVLGKRFFLVCYFSPLELGMANSMKGLTKSKSGPLPFTKEYVIKKAKTALDPKKDHLIRQAARLGLRLKQLDSEQLTQLLYDVYNPSKEAVKESEQAKLEEAAEQKQPKQPIQQNQPS